MGSQVTAIIDQHFAQYPKRSYPKGQILVFANESPEHIFYLVKGKVRKYDVSYRGDEIVVNVFKPPVFFPMSWAINRTPNKYFYKTEEPTELHVVPPDDAVAFIREHPEVMFDLLSRVYRGTEGLLGRIVHLVSSTAKSRLIYELIIESRRFGTKQTDGSYVLHTTESDIAARSGLARETVSREMRKLKDQKLVTLDNTGLIVHDLSALKKAGGQEI